MTSGGNAEPSTTIQGDRDPLPQLIRLHAQEHPREILQQNVGGAELTNRDHHDRNVTWAEAFRRIGIRRGDVVITMLAVSSEAHHAWLGLSWLGAIEAPLNHEYRGHLLNHAIQQLRPKAIVSHSAFAPRFAEIIDQVPRDVLLVITDTDDAPDVRLQTITRSRFFTQELSARDRLETPSHHDIACILFTSGTTGPSKAVRVPWRQLYYTAVCPPEDALGREEAFYSTWPPYHSSGKSALYLSALKRARLATRDRFSVREFWSDVRTYRATFALLGGPLVTMLLAQENAPNDRDNSLRGIWTSPLSNATSRFASRFEVRVSTAFGMTEIGTPISSGTWISPESRSCGRVRSGPPGYEVRVADEYDEPVEPGGVGELIVRSDQPWALNDGYHGMPDQTARAWRNGWFHTGDAFIADADGQLTFVDRMKDCIRRRGENISSTELERYVLDHPSVAECAAFGVPSHLGEEDVKVCVVLKPDESVTHSSLCGFFTDTMPRFMVPRYIEIIDELPRTEATQRVQKHKLRTMGLSTRTWDREGGAFIGGTGTPHLSSRGER